MEALIYVAVGVAGFVLGIVVMLIMGVVRHRRQPTADELEPISGPPPAEGLHLSDSEVDELAKLILDATTDSRSTAIPQYARQWRLTLDLELIAPSEEDALDPERHEVDGAVGTADPTRDGTVADLLSPGIQIRAGRVVVRALVMRHEFDPPRARPELIPAAGSSSASTVPAAVRQPEPSRPAVPRQNPEEP